MSVANKPTGEILINEAEKIRSCSGLNPKPRTCLKGLMTWDTSVA